MVQLPNAEPIAVRPAVLGAIDGVINSFVVITSGVAANVPRKSILIIGIASLVADAFAMGTSEYLSSRTEESRRACLVRGGTCFVSFALFGILPLAGYALSRDSALLAASATFLFGLACIASIQAYALQRDFLHVLIEVVLLGAVAGFTAYWVAHISHEFA